MIYHARSLGAMNCAPTPTGRGMKSILIHQYGGTEVLKLEEIPIPSFKKNEILLQVKAAGVNPVDLKIRKGFLKDRLPNVFPITLGWDASGVVEAVGSEVKGFKPGDEVMAYTRKEVIHDGTYAEYIVVTSEHLAFKPKKSSFQEAAVLPLAGLTAYQVLFESLKIKSGEKILIHAGAGGVGGYAIQMAKLFGAYVLTTSSASNFDYVKGLGADEVIDYRANDFVKQILEKNAEGLDAVFDTVGGDVQKRSVDVLKKGGRLTSILALDETFFKGKPIQIGYVFVRPDAEQLALLGKWVEKGNLKITVSHVFPLREVAMAHQIQESGHGYGKLALLISP